MFEKLDRETGPHAPGRIDRQGFEHNTIVTAGCGASAPIGLERDASLVEHVLDRLRIEQGVEFFQLVEIECRGRAASAWQISARHRVEKFDDARRTRRRLSAGKSLRVAIGRGLRNSASGRNRTRDRWTQRTKSPSGLRRDERAPERHGTDEGTWEPTSNAQGTREKRRTACHRFNAKGTRT